MQLKSSALPPSFSHAQQFLYLVGVVALLSLQTYLVFNPHWKTTVPVLTLYVLLTHYYKLDQKLYSLLAIVMLFIYFDKFPVEFTRAFLDYKTNPWPVVLLVLVVAIMLSFSANHFQKLPKILLNPLLLLTLFYIAVPQFLFFYNKKSLWDTWFFFSHFYWYFVFLIQDKKELPRDIPSRLGFLMPFPQFLVFGGFQMSFLLGPRAFIEFSEKKENKKEFIRFILGNTLLLLGIRAITESVILVDGILRSFATFLLTYGNLIASMNISVALLRLGGRKYASASSAKIFFSTDFLDFFGNLLYYVKEIYLRLFFYPFFFLLDGIKSLTLRAVTTTMVSIWLGGTIFHLAGAAPLDKSFVGLGPIMYLQKHYPLWLSSLLVASYISYAQYRRIKSGKPKKLNGAQQTLRFLFFMGLFFIAYLVENIPV